MEVILLETFDKLGKIGDVVNVKDGFARNFLIPQKKALRANNTNKDYFSKIKNDLLEQSKKAVDRANLTLKKIENKDIVFIRNASDNGQLYGSVSPKDISNHFLDQKIDIKPSSINLYSAIKKIGIYDINVKLHAEVSCILKINVATSEENAKLQKEEFNKPNIVDKNKKSQEANILNSNSTEDSDNLDEKKVSPKDSKIKKLDNNEGEKNKEVKVTGENKDLEKEQ